MSLLTKWKREGGSIAMKAIHNSGLEAFLAVPQEKDRGSIKELQESISKILIFTYKLIMCMKKYEKK